MAAMPETLTLLSGPPGHGFAGPDEVPSAESQHRSYPRGPSDGVGEQATAEQTWKDFGKNRRLTGIQTQLSSRDCWVRES